MRGEQAGDDLGIERGPAGGHAPERADEVLGVGYVLGQEHDPDRRVPAADLVRGLDSLVDLGRRHAARPRGWYFTTRRIGHSGREGPNRRR